MEELNVAFKFKIDGFDYVVFASSETMKCFKCGEEGHIQSSDTVAAVDDVMTRAEHKQVEGTSASIVEAGANEEGTGGSEMAKDLNETDKTADVRMEEDNA
ncbi:hypothetical protein M9458_014697, partial [Cirrhinus mrigala]